MHMPANSGDETSQEHGAVEEDHEPTVTFVPIEADAPAGLSDDRAADLPGVEGYALVVERGPRAGMTWVLDEGVTTIGRHPEDSIFLDDVTVSRHHAAFTVNEGRLRVEDSGSTNGTYVNGVRADEAELGPGDEVIIGKYRLVVAHGDG